MTVTIALVVDDPVAYGATADDPSGVTVTAIEPDTWAVTTSLQLPQEPPWEAHLEGDGTATATADTTVTGAADLSGTGELRAVLPATWAEFETTYPTWADRNGLTWGQLTALETGR